MGRVLRLTMLILIPAVFASAPSFAEDDGSAAVDDRTKIPPWMEIKHVGNVGLLVPKDSEITRAGSQGQLVLTESADAYTARKISDVDKHLLRTDSEIDSLRKEIAHLKKLLYRMRKELKK